jgi:hypothetical protein
MERRDRRRNLLVVGLAIVAWVVVGWVLVNLDPRAAPQNGFIGAGAIGLAVGLTAVPAFWLAVFARHRRIAYRGDWTRAVRRGTWVGGLAALLVVLRLQDVFQPQVGLFLVAMALVAEVSLSAQR